MSSLDQALRDAEYAAQQRFERIVGVIFWLLMTLMMGSAAVYGVSRYSYHLPFEAEQLVSAGRVEAAIASLTPHPSETDRAIEAELQQLADKLMNHLDMPDETVLTIHYVNSPDFNLEVLMGGHIFIYRGMLERLGSQNELVALLGHAIGHVRARDVLMALGSPGAVAAATVGGMGIRADFIGELAFAGGRYDRAMRHRPAEEIEADDASLIVTFHSFGQVVGVYDLIHRIEAMGPEAPLNLHHPFPVNRFAMLEEMARGHGYPRVGPHTPFDPALRELLDRSAGEYQAAHAGGDSRP